jgi:hypothetical protein
MSVIIRIWTFLAVRAASARHVSIPEVELRTAVPCWRCTVHRRCIVKAGHSVRAPPREPPNLNHRHPHERLPNISSVVQGTVTGENHWNRRRHSAGSPTPAVRRSRRESVACTGRRSADRSRVVGGTPPLPGAGEKPVPKMPSYLESCLARPSRDRPSLGLLR